MSDHSNNLDPIQETELIVEGDALLQEGALLQSYGKSEPLHDVNGWDQCFQHKQTQRLMSRLCVS